MHRRIANNAVATIEDQAFNSCALLTTLLLQNNNITDLPDDPFAGLASLVKLDLDANHLSSLKGAYFKPMQETLEELVLSNNHITEITADTFGSSGWELKKLRVLQLKHNEIQYVQKF